MISKRLTKEENAHLRETGIYTIKQFKEVQIPFQSKLKEEYEQRGFANIYPCLICKRIARKLNIDY